MRPKKMEQCPPGLYFLMRVGKWDIFVSIPDMYYWVQSKDHKIVNRFSSRDKAIKWCDDNK